MRDTAEIDVRATIDRARFGRYQALIIGLCMLVIMFDGYDTQSIGYVAPLMAKDIGISMASFGPIFAAGLFGLMLGAMAFGTLADKIGRRWGIILPVLVYSVFSLLTPFAESFASLFVLRFLAGLGNGGAFPIVIAIIREYAPVRSSAFAVNVLGSCFSAGSIIGGLLSAGVTGDYGWQAIFYIGGAAPLVVLLALVLWLPESISFLALNSTASPEIARILRRITGQAFPTDARFRLSETTLSGFTVRHLFAAGRAGMTLLLWVAFFMCLLVLLLLVQWLPSVLRDAGIPLQTAIVITVGFNVGSALAAPLVGLLMDRFNPYVILAGTFVATATFIAIAGNSVGNRTILMSAVLLAGAGVGSTQSSLNALAGLLYQTVIRSTGVGWALGIGRIGAIVGPLIGGLLVSLQWTAASIILVAVAPMLLGAVAIWMLSQTRGTIQAAIIPWTELGSLKNEPLKSATQPSLPFGLSKKPFE
jgi:MFS transporter, AAHS family, 4-hydroxybenzoate transporter